MKLSCDFVNSLGHCMRYTPDGSGRCKKHKGLIAKPKRNSIPRFRGESKYQKEMGMFTSKNE